MPMVQLQLEPLLLIELKNIKNLFPHCKSIWAHVELSVSSNGRNRVAAQPAGVGRGCTLARALIHRHS